MPPLIWAKRSERVDLVDAPVFHPLILHMIDVASVTRALWDSVLGRDLQQGLSGSMGIGEEATGKWLSFWAGLHDLGKASPDFQGKWDEARITLQQARFRFHPLRAAPPHGFITAATLEELLIPSCSLTAINNPIAACGGGDQFLVIFQG